MTAAVPAPNAAISSSAHRQLRLSAQRRHGLEARRRTGRPWQAYRNHFRPGGGRQSGDRWRRSAARRGQGEGGRPSQHPAGAGSQARAGKRRTGRSRFRGTRVGHRHRQPARPIKWTSSTRRRRRSMSRLPRIRRQPILVQWSASSWSGQANSSSGQRP